MMNIISKALQKNSSAKNLQQKQDSQKALEAQRRISRRLSKMINFNTTNSYSGFGIKDLEYVLNETKVMIRKSKFKKAFQILSKYYDQHREQLSFHSSLKIFRRISISLDKLFLRYLNRPPTENSETRLVLIQNKYLGVLNIWYLYILSILKEKFPKDESINDILWDIPALPRLIMQDLLSNLQNGEKMGKSMEEIKENPSAKSEEGEQEELNENPLENNKFNVFFQMEELFRYILKFLNNSALLSKRKNDLENYMQFLLIADKFAESFMDCTNVDIISACVRFRLTLANMNSEIKSFDEALKIHEDLIKIQQGELTIILSRQTGWEKLNPTKFKSKLIRCVRLMLLNFRFMAYLQENKGNISRTLETLKLGVWLGCNFLPDSDTIKKQIKKQCDSTLEKYKEYMLETFEGNKIIQMGLEDELKKIMDEKEDHYENFRKQFQEEISQKHNTAEISKAQFIIHVSKEKLSNNSGVISAKKQGQSPTKKNGLVSANLSMAPSDSSKHSNLIDQSERKGFSQLTTNVNSLHASVDSNDPINNKFNSVILEDSSSLTPGGLERGIPDDSGGSSVLKPVNGDFIVTRSCNRSPSQVSLRGNSFSSNLDRSIEANEKNNRSASPRRKVREVMGIRLKFGAKHVSKILSTNKYFESNTERNWRLHKEQQSPPRQRNSIHQPVGRSMSSDDMVDADKYFSHLISESLTRESSNMDYDKVKENYREFNYIDDFDRKEFSVCKNTLKHKKAFGMGKIQMQYMTDPEFKYKIYDYYLHNEVEEEVRDTLEIEKGKSKVFEKTRGGGRSESVPVNSGPKVSVFGEASMFKEALKRKSMTPGAKFRLILMKHRQTLEIKNTMEKINVLKFKSPSPLKQKYFERSSMVFEDIEKNSEENNQNPILNPVLQSKMKKSQETTKNSITKLMENIEKDIEEGSQIQSFLRHKKAFEEQKKRLEEIRRMELSRKDFTNQKDLSKSTGNYRFNINGGGKLDNISDVIRLATSKNKKLGPNEKFDK